ncbi:MAG: hypothetical protein HZA74_12110 [Ignavibacteriales bacterium]|nr:hypothetical protein [Ignavibacteriales bacterium]
MKKSILFFTIFALVISVSAQNKKEVQVSEKAKATFAKLYPNVKEVKWGKEGKDEFEAEFKQNGTTISVVIDADGNLKETETEISKTELPKGVEEFIKLNHKGWTIAEAAKIVDSKGNTTFEAEISKDKMKKDLMFTKDGKPIVKKEIKTEKEEKEEKEED